MVATDASSAGISTLPLTHAFRIDARHRASDRKEKKQPGKRAQRIRDRNRDTDADDDHQNRNGESPVAPDSASEEHHGSVNSVSASVVRGQDARRVRHRSDMQRLCCAALAARVAPELAHGIQQGANGTITLILRVESPHADADTRIRRVTGHPTAFRENAQQRWLTEFTR
jgi:hypothetical protein